MSGLASRFDWHESTIDDADDGRIPGVLALALGGTLSRGKGRNGYAECINVERGEEVLARVYGRSARAGEAHIVTSSDACDAVVPLVQRLYPEHRISRADSSVDLVTDFDALDARALEFATNYGISHRLVSDSDGGATRYLGAPSSELRVRVYKKSEQLRALHPERASEVPDGVVRVELQARPGKREAKIAAAAMTADELWGLGAWTQAFARHMLDIDAPRVATHFRRPSDWTRALHFLGSQYGPMIERRIAEQGATSVRAEVLEALGL